jgi:hypothetical protein
MDGSGTYRLTFTPNERGVRSPSNLSRDNSAVVNLTSEQFGGVSCYYFAVGALDGSNPNLPKVTMERLETVIDREYEAKTEWVNQHDRIKLFNGFIIATAYDSKWLSPTGEEIITDGTVDETQLGIPTKKASSEIYRDIIVQVQDNWGELLKYTFCLLEFGPLSVRKTYNVYTSDNLDFLQGMISAANWISGHDSWRPWIPLIFDNGLLARVSN